MRVYCDHCGKKYSLSNSYESKRLRCKACQQVFRAQRAEYEPGNEIDDPIIVADVVENVPMMNIAAPPPNPFS